jgi:hypothetical protein
MEYIFSVVQRVSSSGGFLTQWLAVAGRVVIVPARIGSRQRNGVITRIYELATTKDDLIHLPI